MRYAASLLLAALLVACRTPAASGPGATAPGVAEGSGAAAAVATPPPPAALAEGTGAGATEGSARWAAEAATDQLPDLIGLMRASGYPDASVAQLEEFVPVPPGARGVAGRFANASGEVRVAVLAYPNEHYARPHVSDIAERRRLVPGTPEAAVRSGATVVHVRAADTAAADALAAILARGLGWPQP